MIKTLHVKRRPTGQIHHGLMSFNGKTIPCCLGRSGITTQKREGDGATPAGKFGLLYGFYRKDRIQKPLSTLPLMQINRNNGWCDEPDNPNYNQLVELPFLKSHEVMTREDRLYDVCIVLDYNINPQTRGHGSAIFFHQTSPELKPTEGCIAIDPRDMQLLLPFLGSETQMIVYP